MLFWLFSCSACILRLEIQKYKFRPLSLYLRTILTLITKRPLLFSPFFIKMNEKIEMVSGNRLVFKMKDYNKNYLHKRTTVYEATKMHLRRVLPPWVRHALWLHKSYSATDRTGRKTVSAPPALAHPGSASANPARTRRAAAGLRPDASPSPCT